MNLPIHTIEQLTILTVPNPSFKQRLAVTELRRGLYQLGYTGPTIVGELPGPAATTNGLRFVLTAGRSAAERYEISAAQDSSSSTTVTIAGAGEQALLYAVFDFLGRQGAFLGLDGDLYPLDRPVILQLPDGGRPWQGSPRFAVRGLLPWPDFLNCITVFNREDFRAYLEAMLRMRFNTLGIHVYGQRDKWVESFLWRHRIVDPNAGYLARRSWRAEEEPAAYYATYARTQAGGERAHRFATLLDNADTNRSLLSTWTGEIRDDGPAVVRGFAGDYSEAFTVEAGYEIPDDLIASQAEVIAELERLLQNTTSPLERERLGYWHGQIRFLDPYTRAWQIGTQLHKLITEQHARKPRGATTEAIHYVREHGIPLWISLLKHVREAVLTFQRTVATRNDLRMLASIHNKFVRIASFRMSASLLEFLDALPSESEATRDTALAPDSGLLNFGSTDSQSIQFSRSQARPRAERGRIWGGGLLNFGSTENR